MCRFSAGINRRQALIILLITEGDGDIRTTVHYTVEETWTAQ